MQWLNNEKYISKQPTQLKNIQKILLKENFTEKFSFKGFLLRSLRLIVTSFGFKGNTTLQARQVVTNLAFVHIYFEEGDIRVS